MNHQPRVLATDLDGTLIPLAGNRDNQADLKRLAKLLLESDLKLLFVTGRHYESVMEVSDQHRLPKPDWIICDVGTSIYRRDDDDRYGLVGSYQDHQDRIVTSVPIAVLRERMMAITGLRLQEHEKQGRFKLSFYCDAHRLPDLVDQIQDRLRGWPDAEAPYSIISSIDPFNGDGLIDLLPTDISKAYALNWWSQQEAIDTESILFAGDSGNDLAAMKAGYRTIIVSNADSQLVEQVRQTHQQAGWSDRLIVTSKPATSGVLQGCLWFCETDRDD